MKPLLFTLLLWGSCCTLFAQTTNPYYAPPFTIQKIERLLNSTLVESNGWNPDYITDKEGNILLNFHTGESYEDYSFTRHCPSWGSSGDGRYFHAVIDPAYAQDMKVRCMPVSDSMKYGLGNIFEQPNGDVMYVGYTKHYLKDIAFELRDSMGKVKHYTTIGGYHEEGPFRVQQAPDGGYIGIAEYTGWGDGDIGRGDSIKCGNFHDKDIWLFKTDSLGNVVKSRTFGGNYPDHFGDIHIDEKGNVTLMLVVLAGGIDCGLGGCTSSTTGWSDRFSDIMAVRLDQDLNILWTKCYGGSGVEGWYNAVQMTPDGKGGFFVATRTSSSDGHLSQHPWNGVQERTLWEENLGSDLWVFQIDTVGTILQSNSFPFNRIDYIRLGRSLDGSIWVGGSTLERPHRGLTFTDTCAKAGASILHLDSTLKLQHTRVLGYMLHSINALQDSSMLIAFQFSPTLLPCSKDVAILYDSLFWHGVAFIKAVGTTYVEAPEPNTPENVYIYPNPTQTGVLHIDLPNPEDIEVQLTDVLGRVCLSQTLLLPKNTIAVAHLAKGMYIVRIKDKKHNKPLVTQKIVINH
jgi:hypothetical protein